MQLDQEKQAPPASGNDSRQQEIKLSVIKAVCITIGLALAIIGLYFLSQYNYLFFHTTVEVFSIVIAFAIFVIGWNSRRIINNNYLIVISVAFLFIGGLSLLHSLTYRGMNVFEGIDANWATQLWIAMRYLLSLSIVFALVSIRRKFDPWIVLAVFSVIFILLVGSIFFWQIFPVAYIDGQGLTTFKVASEYIISGIFAVAILLLFRNHGEFSGNVKNYLIAALAALIAAELSFTLYVDVYGFFNLAGHLLNLVAFYFIYKAIIETGLSKPHDLLFFNIKKHEETLKKSEERFRGALDNMIEGCQIIGRDWRYIYINDAAERHNRRSRTELLGNRYMDMWPGIESTKVFGKIKECMDTSTSLSLENFFVYPDGKTGWFELRINPIPEGVFILSMDVTERKKVEEALKESEERYRLIVETANEGIWAASPDGKTTFINQRMADMLGYQKEEILGHIGLEFIDSQQKTQVLENRRLLKNKNNIEFECKFIRKDGATLWTLASTAPILDTDGKHIANIAMHTDITDRKKAEEALRQSEVKFRTAANYTYDWEYWIKPDGSFVYISPSCYRVTGYVAADFLKDPDLLLKIIHPDDRALFNSHLDLNYSETKNEIDFRIITKNNEIRWISHACQPVFDEEGKWIGRRISNRDITERKWAEEARDNVQKKLEENACLLEEYANQMEELAEQRARKLQDAERLAAIGATAGMVGHDIRNPLQAITGELYFAKKDLSKLSSSPEKQKIAENFSSIETSVNYINKIVQDLQDFARPIKPAIQETDVDALCKELMQQAKHLPTVSTNCQVDESLKKMPVDGLILRRILTNLVTNAIQAMPDGGNITLEAHKEGTDAVITVTDTGSGIPDDVKPKLFTPLMTTKSKGQGFGLAVVKRMTEALGGSVSFESEVGKGTKFVIRLPIKE